jgi:hypothetical protein
MGMGMGTGKMVGVSGEVLANWGADRDEGVLNFRVTLGPSRMRLLGNMVMNSYEKEETMRRGN